MGAGEKTDRERVWYAPYLPTTHVEGVAPTPQKKPANWPVLKVVRAEGIEPSPEAWEATILPLNYARRKRREAGVCAAPKGPSTLRF